jgi:hypothetical protein
MAVVENTAGETRRERRLLVAEAGYSQVSFISILAGVLVAYGAFAVLAAIGGATLDALGVEFDVGNYDWETVGGIGTAVVAAALFVAYLFGGYVTGRMAFRSGLTHGLLVFLLGVVMAALVGLFVSAIAGTDTIEENLRNVGVPTTADEWGSVGTIAGIASLAAMLVGSILGATWGERWYGKLLRRAGSPAYGTEVGERSDVATTDTDTDTDTDHDDMTPEERMRLAEARSQEARIESERTRPVEVRGDADVDRPVRTTDADRPVSGETETQST